MERRATSATTAPSPPCRKPFLETGEHGLLIAGLDIDDAVGQETGLGEGGREEILPRDAPQHLAPCARGDAGGEQRRGRAVDGAIAAAGDLMQRAERQTASRQMPVDRLDTERQHGLLRPASPSRR